MAKVSMDASAFRDALIRAFVEAQPKIVRIFTEEMNEDKWFWPRPPSPRDIVDTGRLRDSLNNEQMTGPRTPKVEKKGKMLLATHIWYAPYAVVVHEGYTTHSGFVGPPRPWTKSGIKRFKWREHARQVVAKQLAGRRT